MTAVDGERRRADRLEVLDADGFAPHVEEAVEIYIVAMAKPRDLVSTRRSITRRHLDHADLRAVLAFGSDSGVIGFAYGYPGRPGQWWHDAVLGGLPPEHRNWLANSFEVAELHVLPAWQQQGIGRELLTALCEGVPYANVVLSAVDAETPARGLYRGLGFVDLVTDFAFPGGDERYAVMGRALPLDA